MSNTILFDWVDEMANDVFLMKHNLVVGDGEVYPYREKYEHEENGKSDCLCVFVHCGPSLVDVLIIGHGWRLAVGAL